MFFVRFPGPRGSSETVGMACADEDWPCRYPTQNTARVGIEFPAQDPERVPEQCINAI
jgi:hypothetical protein